MKPWIVRFIEENGRLLAVVDALAIPSARDVEAAGGRLIAETLREGSSLACGLPPPNTRREDGCGTAQGRSSADLRPPPKPAARSRLIIGDFGPSDSALAAARGWRLRRAGAARHAARYASGTCARAAPLGAIRPRRFVTQIS